jgi:multiple sugar transport system substrate-binding protein
MKKLLILFLGFLCIPAFLLAAGLQEEETGSGPVIRVISPWSGAELEPLLSVFKDFEAKENVTIKHYTYRAEDLATMLPVQFEAGQTPADIIFMWRWWTEQNSEHAADLTDIWTPEKDAFVQDAVKAGGKVIMIPYVISAKPGFWYRKSFFSDHNLKPAKTWEEFTDLLRKIGGIEGVKNPIVTGDGVGWPISDITEHFIIAFGGPQLQNRLIDGSVKWTDDEVRRVFSDYLVPIIKAGGFSDPIEWTQAIELWWEGEYGLYFMGDWITGMVNEPGDLAVMPLPGTRAVVTAVDYAFIPVFSENTRYAKRLLSFMISRDGMILRAKGGGKLVPRNDIPSDVYPEAYRSVASVVSGMETTVNDLDDSIGGDWQRLFWDQLKLLWVSPDSLDDVLKKLQAELK